MRLLLAAALLLGVAAAPATAHLSPPSIAAVTVPTAGSGSVRVTLPDRQSATGAPMAECVFSFETNAGLKKAVAAEPEPAAAASGRVDPATVAAALSGACVSSTSDYWTYELCFGQHLRQFHASDIYMLGRGVAVPTAGTTTGGPPALVMEGGDMCAALNPAKPRSVKLNLACKRNAVTPQLTAISETSTCAYEAQVATNRVCADERYPVLPDNYAVPQARSAAPGPLDTGSEDWFVEITELDAGSDGESVLMCQAYSLEYRATSVTNLRFATVQLKVNKLTGSSATNRQLPASYRTATARAPGRIDVDPSFLKPGYGSIALDDLADYEGSFSFLKVYA